MEYILSLDAGTSNCRALLINKKGEIVAIEQQEFTQHYPDHGWVEHDPIEIWQTQLKVIELLLKKTMVHPSEIKAIGITNQRETVVIWDKATSEPIWNAIVWNDRRTKKNCDNLKSKYEKLIQEKTGLYIEPYFSASKINWILDNVKGSRKRAEMGELCFGTINTWLLYKLTNGNTFKTDVSNAARTLLFNIHTLSWDEELLKIFNIPKELLPEVKSNSEVYGQTHLELFPTPIPIAAMIGDQQASLFGNACFNNGDTKCTFGTGCFMMMNTGTKPIDSKHQLLTTIAWQIGDEQAEYALEGLVYAAGSVVQWLQDSMGIIKSPNEIEGLAFSVPDSGGVYFVPTFNGLASPYWNASAKGSILGLTPSTNIGHLTRAALEGIAYQVTDVLEVMEKDANAKIKLIKCGGGMAEDVFLMQMQSDLLKIPIERVANKEISALGAGYLAGLAVKFWKNKGEIASLWKCDREFLPQMPKKDVALMRKNWSFAIKSTQLWAENTKIK